MKKEHEEITELGHEPEPGYKTVFYLVFAAALIYLVIIFLMTI